MSDDKIKYRPIINTIKVDEKTSVEETFQNLTLRPVIKMQHALLIAIFRNYMDLKKVSFKELLHEKRIEFIQNSFKRDVLFKNELKGIIIGQFTVNEYETYIILSNDLNKRMMNMIKERLINSMEELY